MNAALFLLPRRGRTNRIGSQPKITLCHLHQRGNDLWFSRLTNQENPYITPQGSQNQGGRLSVGFHSTAEQKPLLSVFSLLLQSSMSE
jgi:hypothetical protein